MNQRAGVKYLSLTIFPSAGIYNLIIIPTLSSFFIRKQRGFKKLSIQSYNIANGNTLVADCLAFPFIGAVANPLLIHGLNHEPSPFPPLWLPLRKQS
jgi:hypothetical protein